MTMVKVCEVLRFMTSYLESSGFLIVTPLNYVNYIKNQIQENLSLTVTLQVAKSLRYGELAVNP